MSPIFLPVTVISLSLAALSAARFRAPNEIKESAAHGTGTPGMAVSTRKVYFRWRGKPERRRRTTTLFRSARAKAFTAAAAAG
jgi:hypothetical protein